MTHFSGLSSPDELLTTWNNMTEGQGLGNIKIIWDFDAYTPIEDIGECAILNLLYSYVGNKTGHYIAIYNNDNNYIYFDPLGTLPPLWILKKFKQLTVDLEGAQNINGNSCGYRCLTKLFKYKLNYLPDYCAILDFERNMVDGNIKDNSIAKTKREITILNNLKM